MKTFWKWTWRIGFLLLLATAAVLTAGYVLRRMPRRREEKDPTDEIDQTAGQAAEEARDALESMPAADVVDWLPHAADVWRAADAGRARFADRVRTILHGG